MTKRKTWIKVKRGLNDPKHRLKMGECWWLYLHILDRANWETGAVEEWRDEEEAKEIDMPLSTLRYQRRKLESEGYITCEQKRHKQRVIIHKWINPRKYDSTVINYPDMAVLDESQGDNELSPSKDEGYNNGDNNGDNTPNTISFKSHITDHKKRLDSKSQDSWVQALTEIQFTHYPNLDVNFRKYWLPTEYGGRQDGKFIVICESEEQRAWLADRGQKIAEHALVGVLGERVEVEFVCG